MSAPITIQGLTFSTVAGGWTLASASTSALTLTNTGTNAATGAINGTNTSGTDAISLSLVLGAAAASTVRFTQAAGGTLDISGNISSTNAIAGVSLVAGGATATFNFSGNNTYAGTTTVATNDKVNINSATAISSGALVFGGNAVIDNTSATAALVLANNNNINLSSGSLTYTGMGGNGLSFGSGVLTVSGAANRTATINGGTMTIGSINADAAARTFTKAGAGILVINDAANANFQGGVIFTGGTLVIDSGANLGTGTLAANGGALQASGDLSGLNKITNAVTLATGSAVSGVNNIEFGGKLTGLTGAATRTLTNSISGGLLMLNDVDISNEAAVPHTLAIAGTGNTTINGIVANGTGTTTANGLTITNTVTITLSSANTYTGTTTMNASAGTLLITGTNNSAGGTTLTTGTLSLGNASNGGLASGLLTLTAGTLLAVTQPAVLSNATTLQAVTVSGTQNLTINGKLTALTGGNRTLTSSISGGLLTLGDVDISTEAATVRTLTVAGIAHTTVNGIIANGAGTSTANNLTITTTLSGANTYTGTTTMNASAGTLLITGTNNSAGGTTLTAGTLSLGNASNGGLASGVLTVQTATLTASGGPRTIANNIVFGNNSSAIGGTNDLTLNGAVAWGGSQTLTVNNAGTTTAVALLGLSLASFTISPNGSTYTTAPTITISGGTAASATVNKDTGLVILTSPGFGFTSAPTVVLSGGAGLVGPGFTVAGSTATDFIVSALQMTGAGTGAVLPTVTFDSGAAAANAVATAVTLGGVGDNGLGGTGNLTVQGVVVGGAANILTKIGNGTLSLNGVNTYNGGSAVNAGTLNANSDASLGAANTPVIISNGATLQSGGTLTTAARVITFGTGGGLLDTHGNTVNLNLGSTVAGTALTKAGNGILNLNGDLTGLALLATALGTTNLGTALGTALGTGTSVLSAGATTNIKASQTLDALNIANGVVVTFGDGMPLAGAPGKLTALVPEPGALGLLLTGVLGLLGRRRR